MPEGIIATDNGDGFVTLDFVDKTLRGPALAELVEIGGGASIETISRLGPRRQYRVPLGNAELAGLVDGDTVTRVPSAGYDTGAAAALVAADPNVNPGADNADWHTPVAEYTSANKFVGQVANDVVLDRVQVHTGDAGSYGGSPRAPLHTEVIEHVKANSPDIAVGGRMASTQAFGVPQARGAEIAGALADQTAALGSDPGAWGDQGGESLAEDYTTVQASRDGETVKSPDELAGAGVVNYVAPELVDNDPADPSTGDPGTQGGDEPTTLEPTPSAPAEPPAYPSGVPTEDWKRSELDAYAAQVKHIDTSQEPNKAAVVTAIQNTPTPA